DTKLASLEQKQDIATRGVLLLCSFVSRGLQGNPGNQELLKGLADMSQMAVPQLATSKGSAAGGAVGLSGLKELEFISSALESSVHHSGNLPLDPAYTSQPTRQASYQASYQASATGFERQTSASAMAPAAAGIASRHSFGAGGAAAAAAAAAAIATVSGRSRGETPLHPISSLPSNKLAHSPPVTHARTLPSTYKSFSASVAYAFISPSLISKYLISPSLISPSLISPFRLTPFRPTPFRPTPFCPTPFRPTPFCPTPFRHAILLLIPFSSFPHPSFPNPIIPRANFHHSTIRSYPIPPSSSPPFCFSPKRPSYLPSSHHHFLSSFIPAFLTSSLSPFLPSTCQLSFFCMLASLILQPRHI
ncbi:unnamed protein product, partial [Closterium sp. Naga37s-1]